MYSQFMMHGQKNIQASLFTKSAKDALQPGQLPIQRINWALSQGL